MSDWRSVRLGDVADVTVGHVGPMVEEYEADGVPFLRSQNVRPHRIDLEGCIRIGPDFHARLRKSALVPGDVVTVRTGKPGTTAVIPPWLKEANCSDLVITRPGSDLDPRWLSYFINEAARGHISAHLVGAVQQHFNVSSAKSMELQLPDIEEQRAIAEVLGALDDKIAANSRVIKAANALAAAEWARCAASVTSAQPLRDVALLHYGKALPARDRTPGPVEVVGSGGPSGSHNRALIDGEGVVVGRKGTVGAVYWLHGPHFPIDTTYWVEPIAKVGLHYLYYALRSARLAEMNSDSAVPGLNRDEAYAQPISVPDPKAHERFEERCRLLFDQVAQRTAESGRLADARDALLPLLMSGKVRVKDAEKIVEGVV